MSLCDQQEKEGSQLCIKTQKKQDYIQIKKLIH